MSKELCRICLETLNLRYIFEETANPEDSTIAEKIKAISDIQISNSDDLPPFVCIECLQKIDNFIVFKSQIKSSHEYLKTITWEVCGVKSDDNYIIDALDIEHPDSVQDQGSQAVVEEKFKLDITEVNKVELLDTPVERKLNECNLIRVKEKVQIQCMICGKLVATKFRLKCHLRVHTGEKPYKCDKCEKSFAESYNLKVHQRIHTGEKPLECKFCAKKFAQATGLTSHMRLHTGECPYACHICGKRFKTQSHLKYHIRLHTGEKSFVCSICDKAFITKSDLKQHLKTHTGERPHICSVCGVKFTRAYHLERHMITHTGERNFRCDICGISYAQKYDLKRHKKIHESKQIPQKFDSIGNILKSND